MLSDVGKWGVANVLDIQFFFIKENWICVINRHYAESSMNVSSTKKSYFNDTIALFEG